MGKKLLFTKEGIPERVKLLPKADKTECPFQKMRSVICGSSCFECFETDTKKNRTIKQTDKQTNEKVDKTDCPFKEMRSVICGSSCFECFETDTNE